MTGGVVKKYYYHGSTRVAESSGGTLYYLLTDHLGSTAVTTDASGSRVTELRYMPYGTARYNPGGQVTTYRYTGQRWDPGTGLYFYGARWYDPVIGRFLQADPVVPDAPDTSLSALTVNFSNPAFLEEIGRENRWRARQGIVQEPMSLADSEKPRGLGVVQSFQEPSAWPRLNQTGAFSGVSPSPNLQTRGPADPQNLNRYAYVRNNALRYVDPSGYWTFGFGLGFTIGLGGGISASAMLVFDDNGNVGIAFSGGGGGYAGVGGSVGIMLQGTNADVIQQLNGPVVQTGGSISLGLSGGGEWVIQEGPTGAIQGLNVNVGAGLDFKIPCPVEMHSMLEVTKVIVIPPAPKPFEEPEWWLNPGFTP